MRSLLTSYYSIPFPRDPSSRLTKDKERRTLCVFKLGPAGPTPFGLLMTTITAALQARNHGGHPNSCSACKEWGDWNKRYTFMEAFLAVQFAIVSGSCRLCRIPKTAKGRSEFSAPGSSFPSDVFHCTGSRSSHGCVRSARPVMASQICDILSVWIIITLAFSLPKISCGYS